MTEFRVYYLTPAFFRNYGAGIALSENGLFGDDNGLPLETLAVSHRELRTIEAESLEHVYSAMQAMETPGHWGADYEASNALLREKGLGHTSMSIGDIAENMETGEFFVVASIGFKSLGKRPIAAPPAPQTCENGCLRGLSFRDCAERFNVCVDAPVERDDGYRNSGDYRNSDPV